MTTGPSTPGVDFFRVDRSGSTRRLLIGSTLMVTIGASAIGAHLVHRLPTDASHVVSLAGGVMVIAGLVLAFGTLGLMLFENVYLVVREDGLLLHDNGRETAIPWDDLVEIRVESSTGVVELRRESAKEAVRWFAGKEAKAVGARLEEAKRKAAHGLLRTPSTPPL